MTTQQQIEQEAREFLSAHEGLSLLRWKQQPVSDKILWVESLKQRTPRPSPFFDTCIRLIRYDFMPLPELPKTE